MNGYRSGPTLDLSMVVPQPANSDLAAAATFKSVEQHSGETRLKKVLQYTACLEGLLLQKNTELYAVRESMALFMDDQQKKLLTHEKIMVQQARKAAMGELMAVLGHRWRQPLNVIALMIHNMKDAWEYGEFDEAFLNKISLSILTQVNKLSDTIDDFRRYISPPNSTDYFCPKQCVKDTLLLLSNGYLMPASIKIQEMDTLDVQLRVAGSQYNFQQVIHNLLCNASDAVQKQQRLIGAAFSGTITISLRRAEDTVVICVADNGGGIAESIRNQIFEPLFTTKQHSNNLGVGLYLSRIIIENNMGGKLWYENSGDGVRFSIRLPIAPAEGG